MVLAMVFGLAPNYAVALIIRTLWGFTNGNLGVLKTYVSEVCSEDMQWSKPDESGNFISD